MKHKKRRNREVVPTLEKVLYDAYNYPGTSFLDSDDNFEQNNLFRFLAMKIREFVSCGGNIFETTPSRKELLTDDEQLRRYYSVYPEHPIRYDKKQKPDD